MEKSTVKEIMELGKAASTYSFPANEHCQDAGPILELTSFERLVEMECFGRMTLIAFSDDIKGRKNAPIGVAFHNDKNDENEWFHVTPKIWKRLYMSVSGVSEGKASEAFKAAFPALPKEETANV